jgi:hypothetical protein
MLPTAQLVPPIFMVVAPLRRAGEPEFKPRVNHLGTPFVYAMNSDDLLVKGVDGTKRSVEARQTTPRSVSENLDSLLSGDEYLF